VDWRLDTDPSDAAYEWQAAAATTFDEADRLDEISVPSLVVHGREDRVVPFENGHLLAERIPDATFDPIDDGSHLVFIEQPDRVNDAISSFLDDV
jgi:pimeloyl-ACP methyl ester carboxylesterase